MPIARPKLTFRDLSQDRREALINEYGVPGYAAMLREYHAAERSRKRLVSAQWRAKRKAELDGYPDYSDAALALIDRWIAEHDEGEGGRGRWRLQDTVVAVRKLGFRDKTPGYDAISERGMAKVFRKNGFKVTRGAGGMWVFGLKGGW